MLAPQMEAASQLQDRAPMGGLEGALSLELLVLGEAEISVSLASLSLALLSPHESRAASPSPSFK